MLRCFWIIAAAAYVLVLGGAVSGAVAPGLDIHQLFEDRCGRCHGHAGAFARNTFVVTGDKLRSRKQDYDIREFLARHGRLGPEGVDFHYDVLHRLTEGTE